MANTKLIKIASRDRSLINGYVWHKNKRMCYRTWLNYTLKNDAIIHPANEKMSIWHDPLELNKINTLTLQKINKNSSFVNNIIQSVHSSWKKLQPFINKKKSITTITEFQNFFHSYVLWWSHASMLMIIPDINNIPLSIKKKVLNARSKYEKFSDLSDQILLQYFKKHFPKYKDISYVISPEEIISLAKHTLTAKNLEIIKKRKKKGWSLINGKLTYYTDTAKLLSKHHLELISDSGKINKNKLKGITAHKGSVQGIARLVLKKSELHKVKNGDILITDATTPDFLPAMKKAAAFVTDEGGITCHAAIVAREMKKPCIVGTKIATKILKDGDLVKVDAKNGIVKIIK